jgi:hypothetical protein
VVNQRTRRALGCAPTDRIAADRALVPATGPAAGGTVVTITGTNLTGVGAVKFDTTNGTTESEPARKHSIVDARLRARR